MNRAQTTIGSTALTFLVLACSGSTESASGAGGSVSSSPTGGRTSGDATGGAATGGASATKVASGGSSSTAASGGKSSAITGGNSGAGGSGLGGKSAVGGSATGGATSAAGGSASGGASSKASGTGGSLTGGSTGNSSTAGTTTGGSSSRVTSSGGTATGGSQVGGATSTGGAATGGTSSLPAKPQVVTSAQNALWQTSSYTTATGAAEITVTEGTQSWLGFGGSFNEAGWDALLVLSEAERDLAIRLLYDAVDGANFASGRIPIGASDYAKTWYTLADTPNDTEMKDFSIDHDKALLIPYVQAALKVKPGVYLWASPWSPPAWMKSNNKLDCTPSKSAPYSDSDGHMKNDATTLTAYALYFEKFVQAYEGEGIPIKAVHVANEPGYGTGYPSCYWDSATYIAFIRDYLGPKFQKDSISAEIWGGTMSAPSDGDIAKALAADTKAMQYVKGFGVQWNTFDTVNAVASKGPVLQTEHRCGNYSFNASNPTGDFTWNSSQYDASKPQNDYAYGVESWKFIRDWIKAGVNGYSAWNMVLDTLGANNSTTKTWHQNALLVVDRSAKTLTKTPAYYVFRHLSQYVSLPATVAKTSGGDAIAFKGADGAYTVVIYNKDATKSMSVSAGGKTVKVSVPGGGWATVNF